jgi:hypothetical protein
MNFDLLVCGFCVVFDEPSVDGRPAELREDYDWFQSLMGHAARSCAPFRSVNLIPCDQLQRVRRTGEEQSKPASVRCDLRLRGVATAGSAGSGVAGTDSRPHSDLGPSQPTWPLASKDGQVTALGFRGIGRCR